MSSNKFFTDVEKELHKRLTKIGVYFTSQERGFLNVSQPYKRSGNNYKGLDPSSPGDFPKKLSGQLQKSMTWELNKKELSVTCGSNLKPYPAYLESSTKWMQARPWLTLGFEKTKDQLGKIAVGK